MNDGETWEASTLRWLHLKYPGDIQPIPATDRGDAGIECYCHCEKSVYQCYANDDHFGLKQLYEKQRDKLTTDIKKFIENSEKLKRILPDGFKVRRYCFIVPKCLTKDLVAHANVKSQEVLKAKLPYVADDFAIMVWDEQYFAPEIATDLSNLIARLDLEMADVSKEQIGEWIDENDQGIKNLIRKIPLFTTLKDPNEIRIKADYWIESKIRADNAFERLRDKSGEIWDLLRRIRQGRERLLAKQYGQVSGEGDRVKEISSKLLSEMIEKVPTLEAFDAEALADGIVGDWLQICKLDFPTQDK